MRNIKPEKRNISAVIVTFNPDSEFPQRLASLREQVDSVLIFDNNSTDKRAVAMLHEISCQTNIHVLINPENVGIATALNKGINLSIDKGYQWVLTLDQDTVVLGKLVDNFAIVYEACDFKNQIGVIGLNYKDPHTGYERDICTNNSLYKEVGSVITSGSLVSIPAFIKTGLFREDFFIDQIDHEYCLRLKNLGYKIIFSFQVGMLHPVGEMQIHNFLWKQFEITNHKPFRRYYIMRNYTVLQMEYSNKKYTWIINKVIKRLYEEAFKIFLFENQKFVKTYAMMLGVWDGIRGKMGKMKSNIGRIAK